MFGLGSDNFGDTMGNFGSTPQGGANIMNGVGFAAGASGGPMSLISGLMPLISGGLNYAGQQQTNSANIDIANANNAASAAMAQKQMDFQRDMSNSSWQRGVKDMEAAGLNPALAFSQGGASTPQGAMGARSTPELKNALGAGVSTALDARRLDNELRSTDAQVGLANAQSDTQETQQRLNESSARAADANAKKAQADADYTSRQTAITDAQMPAIKKHAEIDAKWAPIDAIGRRAGAFLNSSAKMLSVP